MKSAFLGLVLSLCFAVPAFSGEAKEVPSSVLKDAFARAAVAKQAQTSGAAVAAALAKDEWQKKLAGAQAKRSRGLTYAWFGLGGVVVGSVVVGASTSPFYVSPFYSDSGNSAGLAIGTVLVLGGAGLSGYGLYNWYKAGDEIDNLDREGRLKGYFSFLPERGGARVAMTFVF